jgi:hypothetical protein
MADAGDYIQLPDGRWVPKENARAGLPNLKATRQNPAPAHIVSAKDIRLPDAVWRGLFEEYKDLIANTTEAPDIYHFGIIAFVLGVTLARRIWVNNGGIIFPNFYVYEVGPSALTRKGTEKDTPSL